MEEISVKGENYVKASLLAKKFGYTQDYIGQLCRSNQIKATLLGRSWYVNEESLIKHKKGRYRSNLTKSKELVRKVAEERAETKPPVRRGLHFTHYEADESNLMPEWKKEEISVEGDNLDKKAEDKDISAVKIKTNQIVSDRNTEASRIVPRPIKRPVVRTIPAFDSAANTKPKPVVAVTKKQEKVLARRSGSALAMAMVLAVLVGEVALVLTALGMEKRLLTTEDGTDMVLYNFSPKLVANTFQTLVSE